MTYITLRHDNSIKYKSYDHNNNASMPSISELTSSYQINDKLTGSKLRHDITANFNSYDQVNKAIKYSVSKLTSS